MKVTIIGSGYVGLVSGACFAELGHEVCCYDTDAAVIATLRQGGMPIYEPGLADLIARNAEAGRLRFAAEAGEALSGARAAILAVGTPPRPEDGQADLRHVFAAAETVARHAAPGTVLITKSTVPIGTNRQIADLLRTAGTSVHAASNPEFLREGNAIEDFLSPERIVIGTGARAAETVLEALYAPLTGRGVPLVATDWETAEMIKYAANSFLAAKVAFINEMADICERVGADVTMVAKAVGMDSRIGPKFLNPGPGFGGSCFPKDTLALIRICNALHIEAPITNAVVASNLDRRHRMVEKIEAACGGSVRDKRLAILGLTFKPGTDDVREAPALAILPLLLERGAAIVAYDPEGMAHARTALPPGVAYAESIEAALTGADGAVILTEWPQFAVFGLAAIRQQLCTPLLIDLRNVFNPQDAQDAGLRYHSIGRLAVE